MGNDPANIRCLPVMAALRPIYSSMVPHHQWIHATYIHRWCGQPTNIWGQSKSNRMAHIFIVSWPKPINITLYSLVLELMNIIWIYTSVPMNEWRFPVVEVRQAQPLVVTCSTTSSMSTCSTTSSTSSSSTTSSMYYSSTTSITLDYIHYAALAED
jgi:hypothetical protein